MLFSQRLRRGIGSTVWWTDPMLALVGVLASLSSLLVPVQGPVPAPTVTINLECPSEGADQLVITIDNPTDVTYEVEITLGPATPTSEPPFETVIEMVDAGEVAEVMFDIGFAPLSVLVDGDGDFPDFYYDPLFTCPQRIDITATTPESTPVLIELQAPCGTPSVTAHGTTEQVNNFTIRYTPDPGFVGVDTFDYSCTSSGQLLGTITVIVTAAARAPVPAVVQPTFTG